MTYIFECHRCGQKYPIWMVSNKDWKRGVKAMGPNFGPAKKICKPCFEEFNASPKYLTVDEYMEKQAANAEGTEAPEKVAYKRDTVAALWDLPSEYSREQREAVIGWPRGPYYQGDKQTP